LITGQSSVKRAVICNGARYESLSAAARGVNVPLYKLHRHISGMIKLSGIEIIDDFPPAGMQARRDALKERTTRKVEVKRVLLWYPPGENCIERGLTGPSR